MNNDNESTFFNVYDEVAKKTLDLNDDGSCICGEYCLYFSMNPNGDLSIYNNYQDYFLNNLDGRYKIQLKSKQTQKKEHEGRIMSETKSLDVVDSKDLAKKVSDVTVVGNGDTFKLLCKASSKSQGWMKSTKAMYIEGVGCVVQVTTQQGENVSEAVTFVPNSRIVEDVNGGRKVVSLND